MIETLKQIDQDLFLLLNGWHNDFFDLFMYWISNKFIWIPLYICLLYLIYKSNHKYLLPALILCGLMITASDRITVLVFKETFLRLRPCHDPVISDLVHIVKDHCGGSFGFVSSHASNTFALTILISGILREKIKWIAPALIFWALLVSYSRIYLGVHYPGDVLGGIIVGSALGYIFYCLFNTIRVRWL
ncbi:MAG: phosphatase PAP2 family protein [Bacteroidales bacterium]|nr:phosphatase PAP2 family protein [Bacteroidales bacterium]